MLTKKYYIMIAEVLKGYYWGFKENGKNENELRLLDLMINSFCIKFELDNPRFDKKRFEDYIKS